MIFLIPHVGNWLSRRNLDYDLELIQGWRIDIFENKKKVVNDDDGMMKTLETR